MITKKQKPITGGRVPQRKRFVLTNAAATSANAQRQVRIPDLPQQDSQLRVPAPTNPNYRANSQFQKDALRYGGTGKANSVHEMSDPNFRDVGYEPGSTKPKRPGTSIISGYPTRGNKRVAGDGNQPMAKGIKSRSGKMKTNLDIFSPRVLHEAGLTKL